jgi:hypothetical protein
MSVSLRVENRQVVARLEADAPVVREWLHSNQALLRGGLAEHHLTLDRIEVSEPAAPRESNARGREQQPSDRRQPRPRGPRPDGGEPFEVVA